MLYLLWMVIVSGHNVNKIKFENVEFSVARGAKVHKQVAY